MLKKKIPILTLFLVLGYIIGCPKESGTNGSNGSTGTLKIAGQIFDKTTGREIEGISVAVTGFSEPLITDVSGYWSVLVSSGWSGAVTPQSPYYTFDPSNFSYTNLNIPKNQQDFQAAQTGPLPPKVNSVSVSGNVNKPLIITLTGTDPQKNDLTFAVQTPPAKGTLGAFDNSSVDSAAVVYTPNPGYEGKDHFTFVANNGYHDSAPAVVSIVVNGPGITLFVDGKLKTDYSTAYDPDSRTAGRGKHKAFKTLAGAAAVAAAGDIVLIRAGAYNEPLIPGISGNPEHYVVYRNFSDEEVTITGDKFEVAVDLSGRSYIVIEGLNISTVRRWMYALRAHHNILYKNHFAQAFDENHSSKTGLFFQEATYNKILNNIIEDSAEDNLVLVKSDRNLVEGNKITKAYHTLWAVKGGNFNVIRNNYFYNEDQKIAEVFDLENAGFDHTFNQKNCTKYNLIESNVFARTKNSDRSWDYNGIQYGGQNGILRKNIFYDNEGAALDLQIYPEESLYNLDNRVYHNVFYHNQHAGILVGTGKMENVAGNIFKNNILYKNYAPADRPTQIVLGGEFGYLFQNNNIFNQAEGESTVNKADLPQSVGWWQAQYPDLFNDNLQADPAFVNEAEHDFHLKPNSPMIDKGAFLTRAVGAGAGTALTVADAGYFYDGFGIPTEKGDLIQLEGQTTAARITKIDYAKNLLTLDQGLTWTDGQGVSLRYAGAKPDPGVYEFTP